MSDFPALIWVNESSFGDSNGVDGWDYEAYDGDTWYLRADLVDAIRQRALADALAAVEEVVALPDEEIENDCTSEKIYNAPSAHEAAAAIRRLMEEKQK